MHLSNWLAWGNHNGMPGIELDLSQVGLKQRICPTSILLFCLLFLCSECLGAIPGALTFLNLALFSGLYMVLGARIRLYGDYCSLMQRPSALSSYPLPNCSLVPSQVFNELFPPSLPLLLSVFPAFPSFLPSFLLSFTFGPHLVLLRAYSWLCLRINSFWGLGNYMEFQRSNPGWLLAKQVQYLLYCLLDFITVFFF